MVGVGALQCSGVLAQLPIWSGISSAQLRLSQESEEEEEEEGKKEEEMCAYLSGTGVTELSTTTLLPHTEFRSLSETCKTWADERPSRYIQLKPMVPVWEDAGEDREAEPLPRVERSGHWTMELSFERRCCE